MMSYLITLALVFGAAMRLAKLLIVLSKSHEKHLEVSHGEPRLQHSALKGDYDDAPAALQLSECRAVFYFVAENDLSNCEYLCDSSIGFGLPPGRVVVTGLRGYSPVQVAQLHKDGFLQRVSHITDVSINSDDTLTEIGSMSSLTKLEIDSVDNVTNDHVAAALDRLTGLESLRIGRYHLTDTHSNLK